MFVTSQKLWLYRLLSWNNAEYDADFKPDPWQYIAPTPLPDLPAINLDKERRPVIQPPGRRPTPPPTPLPVPQELLDMDDMDDDEEPTGSSSQQPVPEPLSSKAEQRKRKSSSSEDNFFSKPLPQRHSSYPPALSTERLLQSTSNSCETVETTPAFVNDNQTCQ